MDRASEYLMERVAPVLVGRRGRDVQRRLDDLHNEARLELEARIQRGRPEASEWPAAEPLVPVAPPRAAAPEPVPIAPALQVVAVRMNIPPASRGRTHAPTPARKG